MSLLEHIPAPSRLLLLRIATRIALLHSARRTRRLVLWRTVTAVLHIPRIAADPSYCTIRSFTLIEFTCSLIQVIATPVWISRVPQITRYKRLRTVLLRFFPFAIIANTECLHKTARVKTSARRRRGHRRRCYRGVARRVRVAGRSWYPLRRLVFSVPVQRLLDRLRANLGHRLLTPTAASTHRGSHRCPPPRVRRRLHTGCRATQSGSLPLTTTLLHQVPSAVASF